MGRVKDIAIPAGLETTTANLNANPNFVTVNFGGGPNKTLASVMEQIVALSETRAPDKKILHIRGNVKENKYKAILVSLIATTHGFKVHTHFPKGLSDKDLADELSAIALEVFGTAERDE